MPGLAGTLGFSPAAARQVAEMAAVLAPAHDAVRGQQACTGWPLHLGWAHHAGSLAAVTPTRTGTGRMALLLAGEVVGSPPAVLDQFEHKGLQALHTLDGWFSGVLIDRVRQRAWLFNDRYGLGRVYWHAGEEGLFFASEAKALLRVQPALRELDESALAQVHSFGCVLDGRTIFRGVELLPPGSAWELHPDGSVTKGQWFDRSVWLSREPMAPRSFTEALHATLARRVPAYVRGADPAVQASLSLTGGLDGRLVMAYSACAPGELPCHTFGGPLRECADERIGREVARRCGQPHETLRVGPELWSDFATLAAEAVYRSDGQMDASAAVELQMNRRARQLAPVRLTGNYGSEVLRGAVTFKPRPLPPDSVDPRFAEAVREAGQAWHRARAAWSRQPLGFIAFCQVPWHHHARLSVEQSQLMVRSPFLDQQVVGLMFRAPLAYRQGTALSLALLARAAPGLASLPTDRGLVAAPTESWSPLRRLRARWLDFSLRAEYAWDVGMPPALARLEGLLAPLHPERLFLGHHKFYHFRLWYREQLAGVVREVLLDPMTLSRSVFRPDALRRMVTEHLGGRGNYTLELHRALAHEFIHRTLLAPGPAGPS